MIPGTNGVCHWPTPVKPIRSDACIIKEPDWAECNSKPRVWKLPIEHNYAPGHQLYVDSSCAHNEYLAVRNRVVFEVRQPDTTSLSLLQKTLDAKVDAMLNGRVCPIHNREEPMSFHPMSEEKVVNYYGPLTSKGKLYSEAYKELSKRDVDARDAKITCFVKAEKLLLENDEEVTSKDPRAIQFRGMVYSAALARYTLALEMPFYRCTPGATKGLSCQEKGNILSDIILNFSDPVYLELDASRFDAHVSDALLRLEHRFYVKLFKSRKLQKLLRLQRTNKCYTRLGMKYSLRGGRMSGDMNTALGNNVLQWAMITTWLNECGVRAEFIFDGDDSVIVIERRDLPKIDVTKYESFGMKAKLKVRYELDEVEYCKGRFFGRVPSLTFARDPLIALTKDCYTTKLLTTKEDLHNYMYTLGACMAHMYSGIPLMWKLASSIRAKYPTGKVHNTLAHEWKRGHSDIVAEPTLHQRATLDYYGMSLASQLMVESSITVH